MENEKPYTLEMESRGDYLWVLAAGKKLTAAISAAYWDEIADKCAELGIRKVMIEKDFREPVGPQDMIIMAEHLSKVLPGGHVAFLDRRNHDSINELGKKLARNRDVMMQIFKNTGEAEKWLRAN